MIGNPQYLLQLLNLLLHVINHEVLGLLGKRLSVKPEHEMDTFPDHCHFVLGLERIGWFFL